MVMLAEYGKLSLADVLAPAIQMADGYPIEAQLADGDRAGEGAASRSGRTRRRSSCRTRARRARRPPPARSSASPTSRRRCEAGRGRAPALAAGKSRKEAILAAYDRFYKGDIAEELVRGTREQGGLVTMEDLARWKVRIEEPVRTTYKGIDVYKLDVWTQGPAMLQALNILEPST